MMWEMIRSLWRDPCYSSQGFNSSLRPFIFTFIFTSELSRWDHHPATHQNEIRNTQTMPDDIQDKEPEIRSVTESVPTKSEQLHKRRAPHTVQFETALDQSDAGSLTTQAPQMNSVHATINALSAWISAVQPHESSYIVFTQQRNALLKR